LGLSIGLTSDQLIVLSGTLFGLIDESTRHHQSYHKEILS
jgi:hypothetical protein